MKYTVRSDGGELVFASFGELERAFWSGLVDAEDKVQEEGSTTWRRADSFPVLRRDRPLTRHELDVQKLWVGFAVAVGSIVLWGLSTNRLIVGIPGALLLAWIFQRAFGIGQKSKRKKR